MISSKNKIHSLMSIVALTLAASLFAGCSSKVGDRSDQAASSSFVVNEIQSNGYNITDSRGLWADIDLRAEVSFQFCAQDIQTLNGTNIEKFEIHGGSRVHTVVTDGRGCASWTESMRFNVLDRASIIVIDRTIKGVQNYRGSVDVQLGVYAWDSFRLRFYDLRYHHVKETDKNTFANNLSMMSHVEDNLFVDRVIATLTNREQKMDEVEFNYQLNLNSSFVYMGLNGDRRRQPINRGKLKVVTHLVERPNGASIQRVIGSDTGFANVLNGVVDYESVMLAKYRPLPNSLYRLYFRIEAVENPFNMDPYEGFIELGDKIIGRNSGRLFPIEEDMPLDLLIAHIQEQEKVNFAGTDENMGFEADIISAAGGKIFTSQTYQDSPIRQVSFPIKSCLINKFTNRALQDMDSFEVQLVPKDQSVDYYLPVNVDRGGCFQQMVSLDFDIFASQQWLEYELVVRGTRAPFQGEIQRQLVYINPWIRNSYLIDARNSNGKPPAVNTEKPQIFVQNARISFLLNDDDGYQLDKFMQLKLRKKFHIEIQPKLMLAHNFDGDLAPQAFQSGRFRVKLYLLTPREGKTDFNNINVNDYVVLSKSEGVESVTNGRLNLSNIDFDFHFSDLHKLVLTNLLIIHIEHDQEDSPLRAGTFATPFRFANDKNPSVLANAGFSSDGLGLSSWTVTKSSKEEDFKQAFILEQLEELWERSMAEKIIDTRVSPRTLFKQRQLAIKRQQSPPGVEPEVISLTPREFTERYDFVEPYEGWFRELHQHEYPAFKNRMGRDFCKVLYEEEYRESLEHEQEDESWGIFDFLFRRNQVREAQRQPTNNYQLCRENPLEFMDVFAVKHVEKIDHDSLRKEMAMSRRLATGSGDYATTSFRVAESERTSWSWGMDAGLRPPYMPGLMSTLSLSMSGGFKMSTEAGFNDAITSGRRRYYALTTLLYYNELNLSFRAHITRCLYVQPKKVQRQSLQESDFGGLRTSHSRSIDSHRLVHLCMPNSEEERLQEYWYFVGTENKGMAVLRDGADDEENPFAQLVRGKHNFEAFERQFQSYENDVFLETIDQTSVLQRYRNLVRLGETEMPFSIYADNAFPGLLRPENAMP